MGPSSGIFQSPANRLRVVLITQGVSRVVWPVLQQLDVQIVGIAESAPRGIVPAAEISGYVRKCLQALKGRLSSSPSLAKIAEQKSIPYFLLHKANMESFAEWLKMLQTDLLVVYSMSQLLPPEILLIPRLGALNLHPSLLPAYRGPNPWFWVYYRGEKLGGVTLHFLDAGEDTGDMVSQRSYEIPPGMKSPEMQDVAIGKHGVEMLLEALKTLARGEPLPRVPQSGQVTTERARNIKPQEHRTLIDWKTWPGERVWHVMSGTESWLDCIEQPRGLFIGQRWEVQNFARQVQPHEADNPGEIKKDHIGYYVQCRDGIVRLKVRFTFAGFARYLYGWLMK